MVIQEAAEMYLETILVLSRRLGKVRSVDVATEMGYSKPTISVKMKQFRENGYIEMDEDGSLTLTETGRALAEATYERHNLLKRLFMGVGVSEATATTDACRVEHYISEETYRCLKAHFEKSILHHTEE